MSSPATTQPNTSDPTKSANDPNQPTETGPSGIAKPLKNPLLNRSKKERKYFDSADWAMGQEKKG